jgi:DNA-binding CsgD family transcriptional regulator
MALMPRDRHLLVRTLCDVAFPLTLVGLLGLTMDGAAWGYVAPAAAYGGEALFGTYVIVVLCAIAFRSGVNALVLFGFVQAAASLGGLGASAAIGAVRSAGTAAADVLGTTVVGAALALAVCYVVLSRERGDEAMWGVARKGRSSAHPRPSIATRLISHVSSVRTPATSAGDESIARDDGDGRMGIGLIGQSPNEIADVTVVGNSVVTHETLLATCSQVAYEFGLTRREEQVLALLCRGMSAAQIEETLFVSNSTVKTHTHSVYQKLGIHGRQDVISYMSARLRKQTSR